MLHPAKNREDTGARSGRDADNMSAARQQDMAAGHADRVGWYYQGTVQGFTRNKALLSKKAEPGYAEGLRCRLEDVALLGPG